MRLDALAEALAGSSTGGDLRWIQTHISHVFLAFEATIEKVVFDLQ